MPVIFSGQAVKSEMVVLVLEKWGLHPELREKPSQRFESDEKRARKPEGSGRQSEHPDLNDLDRDVDVLIPADEFERAKEILFGESEIERAGF